MTEQITLEQVLKLVSFVKSHHGPWKVLTVHGDVHGEVEGDVLGNVLSWESVETPREKLKRLIQESGDQELMKAFNQLHQENN